MSNSDSLKKSSSVSRRYKKVIIISLSGLALLVIAFYYYYSGWFDYHTASIKCGKQPVIVTKFLSASYTLPNDSYYRAPGDKFIGSTEYYCDEDAAINAGYHHASF